MFDKKQTMNERERESERVKENERERDKRATVEMKYHRFHDVYIRERF